MVVRSKTCDNGDYLAFMEMPFDVSQQQAKLMVTVMLRMHNYHYREQHEDALGTICEQEMANVVASYHVVETTVAKILKEEWQQQYDIDKIVLATRAPKPDSKNAITIRSLLFVELWLIPVVRPPGKLSCVCLCTSRDT